MSSKADYSGMTINERLLAAGTLDAFDDAIRVGDRLNAVTFLTAVDVGQPDQIIEAIIADESRYGRRAGRLE